MQKKHTSILSGSILDDELNLETAAISQGVTRYRRLARKAVARGEGAKLKPAERLLLHWYRPLTQAIRIEHRNIRRHVDSPGRYKYGPILIMLSAERTAVITIYEALSHCMNEAGGVKMPKISYSIGRAVMAEINFDMLKSKDYTLITDLIRSQKFFKMTPRAVNRWAKINLEEPIWDKTICVHIGAALLWHLIGSANCNPPDKDFEPAFRQFISYRGIKTVRMISMNRRVYDIIDDGHAIRQHMRPMYKPMIIKPYPWKPDQHGGYVKLRSHLVSKAFPEQKDLLEKADLTQVHECLNVLNSKSWQVNPKILNVAMEIWKTGGGCAGLPKADDAPLPPRPEDIETNIKAMKTWKRQAHLIHSSNDRNKGMRCAFNMKLSSAEEMKDREEFYFPHYLDFRGRAYPVPPYLNHHGDDLSRAMLRSAKGKPHDSEWLLIHLANMCGADKMPFNERVEYSLDNLGEFKRWAKDPLEHVGWMDMDKPFQALAAAYALSDDDDAAKLPIQIDGTCNGLQHYAALGRDPAGAEMVNMIPRDKPNDVYIHVANAVRDLVKLDADGGNQLAKVVLPIIDRSVVKRTVMTSVYGVTRMGSRHQIYEQLQKDGKLDENVRYKASSYLSQITLKAIGQVCHYAADLMVWMRQVARKAAEDHNIPVQWTTPLGFPVLQPYRRSKTSQIETILGIVRVHYDGQDLPVSCSNQMDGFPPNFIHSLDATHMMMTAKECGRKGIEFAAVHDSYWTHSADVDRLSRILRREFVELHSGDIVQDLYEWFKKLFNDDTIPEPPTRLDYDLDMVILSKYFFA
jgi:DNA-directed RNA polymerase